MGNKTKTYRVPDENVLLNALTPAALIAWTWYVYAVAAGFLGTPVFVYVVVVPFASVAIVVHGPRGPVVLLWMLKPVYGALGAALLFVQDMVMEVVVLLTNTRFVGAAGSCPGVRTLTVTGAAGNQADVPIMLVTCIL